MSVAVATGLTALTSLAVGLLLLPLLGAPAQAAIARGV